MHIFSTAPEQSSRQHRYNHSISITKDAIEPYINGYLADFPINIEKSGVISMVEILTKIAPGITE